MLNPGVSLQNTLSVLFVLRRKTWYEKVEFVLLESLLVRSHVSSFLEVGNGEKTHRMALKKVFKREGLVFESIYDKKKRKRHGSRSWLGWSFAKQGATSQEGDGRLFCTLFDVSDVLVEIFTRGCFEWFKINSK